MTRKECFENPIAPTDGGHWHLLTPLVKRKRFLVHHWSPTSGVTPEILWFETHHYVTEIVSTIPKEWSFSLKKIKTTSICLSFQPGLKWCIQGDMFERIYADPCLKNRLLPCCVVIISVPPRWYFKWWPRQHPQSPHEKPWRERLFSVQPGVQRSFLPEKNASLSKEEGAHTHFPLLIVELEGRWLKLLWFVIRKWICIFMAVFIIQRTSFA